MDDEQDKRCHALINDLQEFYNSSRPTLSTAVQYAHAQAHAAHAHVQPAARPCRAALRQLRLLVLGEKVRGARRHPQL